jgi:signal transduction histidine kinase
MLGWLAIALLGSASIVLGAAVLPVSSLGLVTVALALVVAAATCWRLSRRIAASLHESQAWSSVALLRSVLARREALWSRLPAAAAVWDSDGHLITTTTAWQQLALAIDAPPNEPELVVGDPPRLFVVEASAQPDGGRIVLLREVTRERQALRAKDELLAIVGHELRTPLSSIKGYGQMMARQLATVQDQVQRLDHLIGDVLDTAHADAGRLNLRREPIPISDVITSASDRFRAANPDRKLDVTLDAHALIEGDSERLGQVMDNLLSNAAKYSPPDSTIVVQSCIDGEWVRISVTDSGRGIAPEHLPRLFDRFYRVPVDDAVATPGSGLGLSIVRDLVEAHGGRVEAASKGPGKGSTFTAVLPVSLVLQSEPDYIARSHPVR